MGGYLEHLRTGRAALQAGGQLPTAMRLLRLALIERPDGGEAYLYYGVALRAAGDAAGSAVALDRARALDPGNPDIAAQQARSAHAAGRIDEAIAGFQAVLRRWPDHTYTWRSLFNVALDSDRLADFRDFHLELLPTGTLIDPYVQASILLRHLGDRERGRAILEEGRRRCAATGAALRHLAIFQALDGDMAAAAESFRQARAMAPGDRGICLDFGAFLLRMGETAAALALLETASDGDDETAALALAGVAVALRLLGRLPEALAAAQGSSRNCPNYRAEGFIALGVVQAQTGDWDAALTSFRQARRIDPERQDVALALEICHRRGDHPDWAEGVLTATFDPRRSPFLFPDPLTVLRRHASVYAAADWSIDLRPTDDRIEPVTSRPLFYLSPNPPNHNDAQARFLITSWGHAGAIWLAASMNLHPDMLATVGADTPLGCLRGYDVNRDYATDFMTDPTIAAGLFGYGLGAHDRAVLPAALTAAAPAADRNTGRFAWHVFDELEALAKFDPNLKVIGNIHGLMIGPLFENFRQDPNLFRGRSVAMMDLIRHPIPRTESAIRATIHYHLDDLKPAIDDFLHRNAAVCRRLEQQFGVDFTEPRARAALHVFRQGRQNQVWEWEIRQHPDIQRVLLERLKTEPEYFARIFSLVSGGRLMAGRDMLDRVYAADNMGKGRRTPSLGGGTPAEARGQFDQWTPFERAEFARVTRLQQLNDVYGPFGYDFSFVG